MLPEFFFLTRSRTEYPSVFIPILYVIINTAQVMYVHIVWDGQVLKTHLNSSAPFLCDFKIMGSATEPILFSKRSFGCAWMRDYTLILNYFDCILNIPHVPTYLKYFRLYWNPWEGTNPLQQARQLCRYLLNLVKIK